MSFQSFVVGKSNQLAFAAAERIAAAPAGQSPYNPLYLHAGVGLGKTHLLQAIAQEARRQGKRVAYFTADRFMYGFVAALKSQTALAFKEKLRGIDLLVVDDVQFIQGKSIQQEFGHTINALLDAGKQIVVAGDRLAGELEALDERIRSRLGGGLVVVTKGARGAVMYRRGAAMAWATPPRITAVDAVGAGDAFVSALTVALLEKQPPADALPVLRLAWSPVPLADIAPQHATPRHDDITATAANATSSSSPPPPHARAPPPFATG
jgi:nucleoside-triphosphatase THEP1